MRTRARQQRNDRFDADHEEAGPRSRLSRGLEKGKSTLRQLEGLLKDPRVRLAAAALAIHFARILKKKVRRLSKKRGKGLRTSLETLITMARETATNWLIGSPDEMVGKDRKRAKKLRDRVSLRSSAA